MMHFIIYFLGTVCILTSTFAAEVLLQSQALRVNVYADQIKTTTFSPPTATMEPGLITIHSWVEGYLDDGFRRIGKSPYSIVFFGPERPQPSNPIRFDVAECNKLFFEFVRGQNRNEIDHFEAFGGWDENNQLVKGINTYYSQHGSAEERVAWSRAVIRDGPFLNGSPGLVLPIIFQGPAAERGTTSVYLKYPEIQMVRVGDRTVRLKVTDFESNPVPGERVHLECLAYANLEHTSSNWDYPAYFRQRIGYLLSRPHGNQTQEHFLSRNPTLVAEDYFGSVSQESVITDQQGEAEVEISWPLYRWRLDTWGAKLTNSTDGRVRLMACSERGYLGLFTSGADDASVGSSISLSYGKANYAQGNLEYHIPRRIFQAYTLEGQVIDSITGIAVAEAAVETTIDDEVFKTMTDQDGWYQLGIRFNNGQGTASDSTSVARFELEPVGMTVECSKNQYKTLRKFISTKGQTKYTIQGNVTGAKNGESISNASIRVGNFSTTTDANGEYSLDIDGGGEAITAHFAFEEGITGSVSSQKSGIQPGGISVDYSPDSRIEGQVLFRGHPVNEATISLWNHFTKSNVTTTSDAQGHFTLVLGDGTQGVDARLIQLSAYTGKSLADVVSQKDRLSRRSDTALYQFYDIQAVDAFLANYPKNLASASQSEVSKVEESAVRLANVLLHIYQLDNIGHDYAERILSTLGAVLSDLLEKTDMIAQLTELPGEGLSKDVADQLLEDIRESLNKLTRNFVSALGYSMSGAMPATMQGNTRKFLNSLRENGTDAFKTEMREALLANALRTSAQAQINQAAQRCKELDFSSETATQNDLAYQHLTRQFEALNEFVESENWQTLVNTAFESVEEAAGYAKYVGSPLGWYKFIELVENSSGVLSKALAGAGAAHAMSAFGDLAHQIPVVVQLDLGDLHQLPSQWRSAPQMDDSKHASFQARNFTPLLEEEITPLLETTELLNRLQHVSGLLAGPNRPEIIAQTVEYLGTWHAYERRMDAALKLFTPDNLPATPAPLTEELRSQLIQVHQDTLFLAMKHSLQWVLVAQDFEEIDFSTWGNVVETLMKRVIEADTTLNALTQTVTPLSNQASITGVAVTHVSSEDDTLIIAVTVSNPGKTTIDGLSIVGRPSAYLRYQSDKTSLPAILPGQSVSVEFAASLNPQALRGHAVVEFQLNGLSQEHDTIQSSLPIPDTEAPMITVLWPPQRQFISALQDLVFHVQDNRPVDQLRILSLELNQDSIPTEGLSFGDDDILIIKLALDENPNAYSGRLKLADAAGRESEASFEFSVGNSSYPMFAMLNQPPQWFNPAQSSVSWDVWTGTPTGFQTTLSLENGYHELPVLEPDSMPGRTTITWDGLDSSRLIAPSGTYKLAIKTLSNLEIHNSSVHLITEEAPITELRVIQSNLAQGGYLAFAVNLKSAGNVDCKYGGYKFATLSLDAGPNHSMCWPVDSSGNRVTHLSYPIELEFKDNQNKKWSYFLRAPSVTQELPPAILDSQILDPDEEIPLETPIPVGTTLQFSISTTGTKGTSAFLLIRDAEGNLIEEAAMIPMSDGVTFSVKWDTAKTAPSTDYEWIVQLVDASGQSAPFAPHYFNLIEDGTGGNPDADGDGMDDAWERLYGGDLHPYRDDDNDRAHNYREFISGTDPTDPQSRLELYIQMEGADKILLEWETQPGRIYRVWGRNRMDVNEPWVQVIEWSSTPEDGGIISLEIPLTNPTRFYLLEVFLESP